MPEIKEVCDRNLDPAQAAELALLVDLEARWENLRNTPARDPGVSPTMQDLHGKQKAYEVFRAKLAAYNKRYTPPHVPELLLNTASRLGTWCRRMRDLYVQVEPNPAGHCPVHLLEKAYRCADRVAVRMGKEPVRRSTPPADIGAAIRDLEALCQWSDELARVALPIEGPLQQHGGVGDRDAPRSAVAS
jgi:hypothetical protein